MNAKVKLLKSTDHEIRAAIVTRLLAGGVARCDIRHEITLDTSSAGGRADIVLLHRDRLACIEIKSGRDKLDRLATQIPAYERAFDTVRLIVDKRHCENLTFRHSCLARWVFWCAERRDFVTKGYRADGEWKPCEPGLLDPSRWEDSSDTAIAGVARLLWADEARGVARSIGSFTGGHRTRSGAIDWMRENARLCDVRPLAVAALRSRELNRWESAFWGKFDATLEVAA